MRPAAFRWFMVIGVAVLALSAGVEAEEAHLSDDEVVVRREGAHRLLLPKDWPVEEGEGRLAPIPIEGYLSMKFGQVSSALDQVDQRLEALERRLRKLEDDSKTSQMRLRLLETAARETKPHEGR